MQTENRESRSQKKMGSTKVFPNELPGKQDKKGNFFAYSDTKI